MKVIVFLLSTIIFIACDKQIAELKLPSYDNELVVEMYLVDRQPLKCMVSETLPYSSTTINNPINNALVILYDGTKYDTLHQVDIYEYESGRIYNYGSSHLFFFEEDKTYTLTVIDSLKRKVTAVTSIPSSPVTIKKLTYTPSSDDSEKFSVGFSFLDPANINNYYRAIIGKGVNNYMASHTDMFFPDISFEGLEHSIYSEPGYKKNDTVTVRLYSLLKEHYDFIQLTESARTANANPFMQPVQLKSNIKGGRGIFTAVRFDEKHVIVR